MSSPNPTPPSKPSSTKPTSSLSSHFAMIELKQRILASISKLSDRDTHQIALSDLQSTVQSISPDAIPMLLNCLYSASSDPNKPSLKKDSLALLALLATSRPDPTVAHLPKIIAAVVRRLKDSDSAVREACCDAVGAFASQYLRGDAENSGVSLFVKPLFEALNEQNKMTQAGAAMCLAKMVECAQDPPILAFQKLCPRICKFLNNQNFLAKAALLSVVSSLSQVRAIAPQSVSALMQSIHECLPNTDWATRKAAADALCALASCSSHLVADWATSTITALEDCRFDRVKPVRDSVTEALQLWKKVAGTGEDGTPEDSKTQYNECKILETSESVDRQKSSPNGRKSDSSEKDGSSTSPTADSHSKSKGAIISDRTVGILKKKAPALTDKELNPDFFQKLETRGSGDLPVEVVVPRRSLHSSHSQGEEEPELNGDDSKARSNHNAATQSESNINYHNLEKGVGMYSKLSEHDEFAQDKSTEQRVFRGKDLKTRGFDGDERADIHQRDMSGARVGFPRSDASSEGSFLNNKGNWLAIQRQLAQLERQQANLMNMLQDFMGGSHDTVVTLENRVRGLERVVEDMARDLALTSGRRGSNFMMGFEGSAARSSSKYNSLAHYSSSKLGRGGDGPRHLLGDRFLSSDGLVSGVRGRESPWRSDVSEAWNSYAYGSSRSGPASSRRAPSASSDGRLPRTDSDGDQVGSRRNWEKGPGPVRLGEGPSARSVWQASKDEATLEAIRVAGEDNGTSRTGARVAIPELVAESLGDDNVEQERDPLWASWSHAMDALHVGDVDSAFAEILSTGDDVLLVKLMDRSNPVLDQLSNEIANEILHAIGQFLLDQNLFDIGLSWIQQLTELVMENGADCLEIPMETKKELLLSLHEASTLDPPEDWEGATAEQLMLQLASSWRIDIRQFEK